MVEPQTQSDSEIYRKKADPSHHKRYKRLILGVAIFLLLVVCFISDYIKQNQHAIHNQISVLEKRVAFESANNVDGPKMASFKDQLTHLKNAHVGPIPSSWLFLLNGEKKQIKQLQSQLQTLWTTSLAGNKQQATAALSLLKKTEQGEFTKEKQGQLAIQKAKTPKEAEDLAKKWTNQRIAWLAKQEKLKMVSGGWINGHPADIEQEESQLKDLLKKLTSHPYGAMKANQTINQVNHYFQLSIAQQLQQHTAIKNQLNWITAAIKQDEATAEALNNDFFNKKFTTYINSREGQISIAVYNKKNGQTYLFQPSLLFDTASIVKVSIMADLLYKSQKTNQPLTQQEKNLMIPMIENSSNSAASSLWAIAGGAEGIKSIFNQAGMTQTTPGENGEWGLTKTSALDQVKLMQLFAYPNSILRNDQRQYGLNLMQHVTSWEKWGVSGGIPGSATLALKNGWLPYPSKWWINSIGHISGSGRDYCIAVLSGENPSKSYGIATINHISQMIWSQLGKQ